jgi:hypothetical protein
MSGSGRTVQTETSRPIREQINLNMVGALQSCQKVGESMTVLYSHRGYQCSINLLRELFDLRDAYHVAPAKVLDSLDRAIGAYEKRKHHLYWQMFNPLFWLRVILVKAIGIPFQILGAAGFDAAKIEKTTAGRVIKLVFELVIFAAAILTILTALQSLGWLVPIRRFFLAVKESR